MREIERDRKRRRESFCASQRVGLFFFGVFGEKYPSSMAQLFGFDFTVAAENSNRSYGENRMRVYDKFFHVFEF